MSSYKLSWARIVESLRHREKKGEIGVKTRNRGDCNWRSYQMFHSGFVVYFARKTKNANIKSQYKTKLSRDLAAPPCFSTPSGGLGLQRSAAAWLTDGRFWRRGPGRQSTCQLAFPGCFFTTKAPGLLERSRSQKRSGSFSFFLLFLCKPLFWHATLPNGGREQSRFGWSWWWLWRV